MTVIYWLPQIPVCRGDVSELSGKPDAGIQNEHIPWKTRFRSVVCIAVLNSCIKSFLWYASISRKPLIHSLSTDGHKGSFIGIMFVLHSCCVSAAFTTTSETVYWYNVGRDFRHARCRCWYCRRRYGSERPEVSLFPVNYLISCWKDAVKVLPWNGASQPWQHPSSKIMDTYRE